MKNLYKVCLFLTAVIVLAVFPVNAQEPQKPNAEQEVRSLERQWLDAYEQRDSAAMDKIVASDWMITYPDGRTQTKEQIMRFVKSPRKPGMAAPKFSSEDVQARVYGDTVVLTGRLVTQWSRPDGTAGSKQESRYTDTYLKRDGHWQVVASHMSNGAAEQKPAEQKPAEQKPAEQKPAEQKPAEQKP